VTNLAHTCSPLPVWDWEGLRDRGLAVARRMLRSPEEAEEVVQEAMLRAWRSRDRCGHQDDPAPWVLTIVRNEALRRLSGRTALYLEDMAALDLHVPGAGDEIDLRVDVGRALAHLDDVDQALIAHRYGADLTYGMLARTFAMPEGTVKVRLHRARKRLRAVLEEH
jgi:RNA polymerase sigma-70 factor, ECF subfamily